jgi:hypothetical protein
MTIFSTILLILVASCSTPYTLRHSDPIITYSTTKPGMEVKKCIYKKWEAHLSGLKEVTTDTGWEIQYSDSLPSATKALVSIDGEGEGATVNYYNSSQKLRAHRLENEVNECK